MNTAVFSPRAAARAVRGALRTAALACTVALAGSQAARSGAMPAAAPAALDTTRHVIHVSVDGLRADAAPRLGAAAPNFRRLRIEGAFTENARTDYDYTVTLPNHACELTARPVLGPSGHGVSFNSDDPRTIEEVRGFYVAGAFDVAHDNGLRTSCFAGKAKFSIFDRSWNAENGAPDLVGPDDGRDKIDVYRYDENDAALLAAFLGDMEARRPHYAFLHFADPDGVGHDDGWESIRYFESLMEVDRRLGRIFDLVESDPALAGRTWIVVASDHGGVNTGHGAATDPSNYTIPLYVWGPGVAAGADLYELNPASRLDPGSGRPGHDAIPQPVRNAEAANVALDILGLGPVPGSLFDAGQDLALAPPGGLPAVAVVLPAPGTTFPYPSEIPIEAEAPGVERVEFFVNGELAGTDAASPYEHVWSGAPIGVHRITARAVGADGAASSSAVTIEVSSTAGVFPGRSSLGAPPRVFPNPSGGRSTIFFDLPEPRAVEIGLYDVLGRRIDTVFRGSLAGGAHSLPLDARAFPSGVYFYLLASGFESRGGKITIAR